MYKWHGLREEACTSALLLRSPARELRPTLHCAGPTPSGRRHPCALSWKKTGPEDTEKSDPSGWSGSPCAVLRVVSGAPVALLAHLVLDKPVRVCQRGTGLSAVEFGPLGCCKEARWSSTCLFTLGGGLSVRGGVWTLQQRTASLLPPHVQRSRPGWPVRFDLVGRCKLCVALRGLRDDAVVPASRWTSTL